jgi:hypothetical protein
MVFTDPKAWLEAHELIECKPLKGRWTLDVCLEMSKRVQKVARNAKSPAEPSGMKNLPCANCPILAALEK